MEDKYEWMINRRKALSSVLEANKKLEIRAYQKWVFKETWHPLIFWGPSRETLETRYVHLRDISIELAYWQYHLKVEINKQYGKYELPVYTK